jgi:hypothetical protein
MGGAGGGGDGGDDVDHGDGARIERNESVVGEVAPEFSDREVLAPDLSNDRYGLLAVLSIRCSIDVAPD